jgi:branched-chain amino acid transport system substrate-binding protein
MTRPIHCLSPAIAGAAVIAVAIAGSDASAQSSTICSVVSATGPASLLGAPEDKTLHMYVDKINAEGGVAGRRIELIIYDDGGDATRRGPSPPVSSRTTR